MMISSLCRPLLLALAVFGSFTARAEIAASDRLYPNFELYFVDGDTVRRADCDHTTTIYNRATCAENVRRASANLYFQKLSAKFGPQLDKWQLRVRETWVNVDQVDARLLQLVSSAPDQPSSPVTWEQIVAKRDELAQADATAAAAADQIARITSRIADGDNDQDLALQLGVWRVKLAETATLQGRLQRELTTLTQQYVQVRADTSDDEYRSLATMRTDYLNQLASAQAYVEQQVGFIIKGEQTTRKLKEQGFTWIASSTVTLFGIREVIEAFEEAELESRTYRFGAPGRVTVVNMDIPVDGNLDSLSCRFPVYQDPHCEVAITSPGGFDEAVQAFNAVSGEVKFDSGNNSFHRQRLLDAGIERGAVRGAWQIRLACSMISNGPTTGGTDCAIRLLP